MSTNWPNIVAQVNFNEGTNFLSDREMLIKKYSQSDMTGENEGKCLTAIGAELGVHSTTVYRRLRFHKVPRRRRGAGRENRNSSQSFEPESFGFNTEKEMLLYWREKGLSYAQIRNKLKFVLKREVSIGSIVYRCRKARK